MKHTWRKKILGAFLSAALLATAAPLPAASAATASPLAAYVDEDALNPDYVAWCENGKEGPAPSAQDFSYLDASYASLLQSPLSASDNRAGALPSSYDLREEGRVDPVSNQGDLGVCWAIAANSAAAGSIRDQFPQLSLSAMHTAWFCYHGDEEEEFAPFSASYLSGGNDGRAVGTLAAWKGPVTADRAPLEVDSPPNLDESLRHVADYHLQDAYYMPTGIYHMDYSDDTTVSGDIIKQILTEVGPVTMSYYAHGTNTYNAETHAVYNSIDRATDHAVLVVGWDDDYAKENFVDGNQPQHDGAWLVRNSWGSGWGDDGYFWLSYEDRSLVCGNAYLLEEADNYTTNYQYDTTGWSYSVMTDPQTPTTATAANIFTAEGDEQLEAVSFYTTDAGARYTISVYTGVDAGAPTSGTEVIAAQSGREAYAGYHTVELEEAVPLEAGERFSIVVTFENPTYSKPLAIEWCQQPSPGYVPVYMGNGGESYVLTDGQWQDIAGSAGSLPYYITNVCIKGFTNPLPKDGSAISTVRFSQMEGPVTDGTTLSLSAADGATIYYRARAGAAYQRYDEPIALDSLDADGDSITISAYAEKNGKRGNTTSKTYTRATASLTDLAVKADGTITHYDITQDSHEIVLPDGTQEVQIMAQSGDTISINGTPLTSADWSAPLTLSASSTTKVKINVQAEGKSTSTTTLSLRCGSTPDPGPDDPTRYTVALDGAPDHGSLLFSPTRAIEGETVTLTATPDEGYTLDSLIVNAPDQGRKIEVRALGDGRYSFTMPASDVEIQASFIPASDLPFDDVKSTAWYYEPVRYVFLNGLMVGTTDTHFAPNDAVNRAMIWAVLARQAGADTPGDGTTWYNGVQTWAVENGISDGLRPEDAVSRQELVTMLYRYSGSPAAEADLSAYEDAASIAAWAADAMAWGVSEGLITGLTETTLAPGDGATRAQLAAILTRYLGA